MHNDGKIVSCLFPREEAELLRNVAEDRGEDVSSLIRRLVYRFLADLSYLDARRKKALGIELEIHP